MDGLKQYLLAELQKRGAQKAGTALAGARLQKSPPSVDVTAESVIPAEYMVPQPPVINRVAILQDLKLGKEVPGAEMRQGVHVRLT